MKPQDIGFIIVFCVLLVLRRQKLFVIAGLACFFLAIPLFVKWIFFTGERLVWYGAAFVTVGILYMILLKEKKI